MTAQDLLCDYLLREAVPSPSSIEFALRLIYSKLSTPSALCNVSHALEQSIINGGPKWARILSSNEQVLYPLRSLLQKFSNSSLLTEDAIHLQLVLLNLNYQITAKNNDETYQCYRNICGSLLREPSHLVRRFLHLLMCLHGDSVSAVATSLVQACNLDPSSIFLLAEIVKGKEEGAIWDAIEAVLRLLTEPSVCEVALNRLVELIVSLIEDCKDLDRLAEIIMMIHDCLSAKNYTLTNVRSFSNLLHRFLSRIRKDPSRFSWFINNICSNLQRLIHSTLVDRATFFNLVALLRSLSVIDSAQVLRLLEMIPQQNLIHLMGDSDESFKLALDFIPKACIQSGRSEWLRWWSALCLSAKVDGIIRIMDCIEEHFLQDTFITSTKLNLINPTIINALNIRNEHFLYTAERALAMFARLMGKLAKNSQFISLEFARVCEEYLQVPASSLLKARFTGASPAQLQLLVRQWDRVLDLVAGVHAIQVVAGLKTWKQILPDYSLSSNWILYGNSPWHRQIPLELYRRWMGWGEMMARRLTASHEDLLIATLLSGLVDMHDYGQIEFAAILWSNCPLLNAEHMPTLKVEDRLHNHYLIFDLVLRIARIRTASRFGYLTSQVMATIKKSCSEMETQRVAWPDYLMMLLRILSLRFPAIDAEMIARLLVDCRNLERISPMVIIYAAECVYEPSGIPQKIEHEFDGLLLQFLTSGASYGRIASVPDATLCWILERLTAVLLMRPPLEDQSRVFAYNFMRSTIDAIQNIPFIREYIYLLTEHVSRYQRDSTHVRLLYGEILHAVLLKRSKEIPIDGHILEWGLQFLLACEQQAMNETETPSMIPDMRPVQFTLFSYRYSRQDVIVGILGGVLASSWIDEQSKGKIREMLLDSEAKNNMALREDLLAASGFINELALTHPLAAYTLD